MAQLVVAAAGAAVGFAVGGPAGARIGFSLGSMVGGAIFAETAKSEGPRLGDLSVGASTYGAVLPLLAGTPRVAGNVVWASNKRELATTQETGGKGGGGQEYTTYTYEIDLLILLADNPIEGILRCWQDGKLIYTARAEDAQDSQIASETQAPWTRMTALQGGPNQLPDPTYEAAVGTGLAPAYRGRGGVFIEGLQLGSSGQISNLTWEVAVAGTTATYNYAPSVINHFDGFPLPVSSAYPSEMGPDFFRTPYDVVAQTFGNDVLDFQVSAGKSWRAEGWVQYTPTYNIVPIIRLVSNSYDYRRIFVDLYWEFIDLTTLYPFGLPNRERVHLCLEFNAAELLFHVYINGSEVPLMYFQDYNTAERLANFIGLEIEQVRLHPFFDEFALHYVSLESPIDFGPYSATAVTPRVVTPATQTLAAMVSALCQRAGLSAAQYDVSALASVTQPVRSLSVSQVSSVRAVLQILMDCYFVDAVLRDKIYFVRRSAAPVASIGYDALGMALSGQTADADALPLTLANEMEVPAQLALSYTNVNADHQLDTQYSDRLLTGQESTATLQVPLGFTPTEAKAIAQARLEDGAISALSTRVVVGLEYTQLEPADCITLSDSAGNAYAMRITKKTEADTLVTLDCVAQDATVLQQAGTTSSTSSGNAAVTGPQETYQRLLDLPLLRDADDYPGFMVAGKGVDAGWSYAGVYTSADDVNYTLAGHLSVAAVIGTAVSALASWTGGVVMDTVSTLRVYVGEGQLSSVSRADLLLSASTNAAAVGSEVLQFQTATLLSAGNYELSNFLRGRRGTEWAQSTHVAGDVFVLLDTRGKCIIKQQTADLGKKITVKSVTAGQRLSSAYARSITPQGVNLKPLAGVNARANRDSADTTITWQRRTRLSTSFTGSTPLSAPLGEAVEAYEIDIYSSAARTTVLRKLTSSTTSVVYTSAQQVADFGYLPATLHVSIYQMSERIGRGYALAVRV